MNKQVSGESAVGEVSVVHAAPESIRFGSGFYVSDNKSVKKQSWHFKRLSSLPVLITFTFQVSESGSVRLQLRKVTQVLKVYTINELPHPWKIGNTVVSTQENEDESQKIFSLKMNSIVLKCRIFGNTNTLCSTLLRVKLNTPQNPFPG